MDIPKILEAFGQVTAPGSATTALWVKEYQPNKDTEGVHQFLFFLKPESTAVHKGVKLQEILQQVEKAFAEAQINIGAVRVLGGPYLDQHNIMVDHYGVISKISKHGVSVISDQAKEKLNVDFKDALAAGAEVLGGNEFLAKQPEFNAFSLTVLNDNLGTKRLAGGTYAMHIKVLGKPYILLNPFHAYQLVPYTTPGHALIAFEGLSKTSWADLRQKVCGATDPKEALPGSLRNFFLNNKESLGLEDVDKGTNGVHMSAGPLEGMVELRRFFTDHAVSKDKLPLDHFAFANLLVSKGLPLDRVEQLATNPTLSVGGKNVSAFDATEEHDAADAASTLLQSKE